MKKLLIVAAIAVTATLAHAGAYTWGFGSGADAEPGQVPDDQTGDGYLVGGTAMLFLGTIAQTATGSGSGIDTAYNLDFTGLTKIASSGQDDVYFTYGQTDFSASNTNDAINDQGGQAYTLILFKDDGVTDYANYEGYYYAYTGTSIGSQDADTGTDFAMFVRDVPVGGSDWLTASLTSPTPPIDSPEPTSGLLLLLGVAGLALKRKKA